MTPEELEGRDVDPGKDELDSGVDRGSVDVLGVHDGK